MTAPLVSLPTTGKATAAKALAGVLLAGAVLGTAGPAFAKAGVEGAPAPCSAIVVNNSGKTVRNRIQPPDIKFSVTNCTGQATNAVVTMTEPYGFFATTCPAPLAAPMTVPLAAGAKVAASAPAYRGSCGWYSQSSPVFVDGYSAWQAHTIVLTLTDANTGTVLGTSSYSWKDDKPGV